MPNINTNEIVNIFKRSFIKYVSQEDLHELIVEVAYLYWNAKFVNNYKFDEKMSDGEIRVTFTKDNDIFSNDVMNTCLNMICEANLSTIIAAFNKLTEDEIKELIYKDLGIYSRFSFSTPESLSELAIKILETVEGEKVLDLCSYTGNFLTSYARKQPNYKFGGIDINEYPNNLIARIRLKVLGVNGKIENRNVLEILPNMRYNKVFCNYPFSVKLFDRDYGIINKCKKRLNVEFSKKITSDWAFINSMINCLAKNGKAVAIMPSGLLFKLPDQVVRKELIENGLVETVIALPGKLFANTGIETNLVVFSENNKQVKFINARNLYESEEYRSILNVEKIFSEYVNTKKGEITKIVDIEELQSKEYSLLPEDYMDKKEIKIKNPKKLADIAEVFRGYQISSRELSQLSEPKGNEEPYKVINITNINDGEVDNDLTIFYPNDDRLNRYILKDKDILLTLKGTSSKAAVVNVNDDEKYIASGNLIVIRTKAGISPNYLKIFLESGKGNLILDSIKSGGALPTINMSKLKEIDVPVPELEEQKMVMNRYLAKKDEIAMLKKRLKAVEESIKELADSEF